jgi:hypothetical protein
VNLTEDEPGMIRTYAPSPEGRYVAIAPEVRRGAAIWRIDLEGLRRQAAAEEEGASADPEGLRERLARLPHGPQRTVGVEVAWSSRC